MNFYETVNDSKIFPRYEFHESYVANPQYVKCTVVGLAFEQRCDFVTMVDSCGEAVQLFNYVNFLYCTMDSYIKFYFGVMLMVLLTSYIFIMLGETAGTFFCPALTVISHYLQLSENLAGATLLAFGNGSPDIFTALSENNSDTEMLFSQLYGAGNFVVGVVAAVICLIHPFQLPRLGFLCDVFFYIVTCIWLATFFNHETTSYGGAYGTLSIYLVYLSIVVFQHFFMRYKTKKKIKELNDLSVDVEINREIIRELEMEQVINLFKDPDSQFKNIEESAHAIFDGMSKNDRIFKQFVESINPINEDEWNDAGVAGKISLIIKAPILFSLTMIIPIVDYSEQNHGWSKLLNVIHMFVLATILIHFLDLEHLFTSWIAPVILYSIVSVLAIIVFFTSRTDKPPKYHLLFAVGSLIGSIFVISTCANEVVSILITFGIVFDSSHSILGITILAYGNCIGDLISNITIAKKGFSRMGFIACFAGPMFNTLVGIGLVFIKGVHKSEDGIIYRIRQGALGTNGVVFLLSHLVSTSIFLMFTGFRAVRCLGILSLTIYGIFLVFCILGELNIIHPFGTDHEDELI